MKNQNLLRIFALLMAAMLVFASAAFAEAPAEAPAETTVEEAAAEPVKDTLLVTLNGEEIREDNENLQYYLDYYNAQLEGMDDPDTVRIAQMFAMENTVQIELIFQHAKAALTEEDKASYAEQINAEWEEVIESYMEQDHGITAESSEEERTAARADVLAEFEADGWTAETYADIQMDNMIYNGFIEKLQEDPSFAVSDEEVEAYLAELAAEDQAKYESDPDLYVQQYELYQQYPEYASYYGIEPLYYQPAYRGITHILLEVDEELLQNWIDLNARLEEAQEATEPVSETEAPADDAEAAPAEPTEEPVTEEMVAAARQAILDSVQDKLDEIAEKLENGATFEELIAEYNTDPGMQEEPYKTDGYLVNTYSASYAEPFASEAMALEKIGDISDPVLTQFGIHLLYYLKDLAAGPVALTDQLKEDLRGVLGDEKFNDGMRALLEQWEAEADTVWTEEGISWQYDQSFVDAFILRLRGEDTAQEETPAEEPAADESAADESAEAPATGESAENESKEEPAGDGQK